ncbi:TPA: hypothetical protein ACS99I_000687 [Streptococcus agalactiae]
MILKDIKKRTTVLFLAIMMTFMSIAPGIQSVYASSDNYSYDNSISYRNTKESIEQEAKFIFEEASSFENGKLSINRQLLEEKYGEELSNYIILGLERIYYEDDLAKNLRNETFNQSDDNNITTYGFVDCMKGEIIGMIPGVDLYQLFTSGDLVSYIKGKAWGKVAEIIAKQLVKYGLKSNVAGIVAQLGISSGKCAVAG